MKGFVKAVIILAKSLNRIAKSLEGLLELYRLKCSSEGIEVYQKSKNPHDDEVVISYGSAQPVSPLEFWRNK